jgi:hypothetical protein
LLALEVDSVPGTNEPKNAASSSGKPLDKQGRETLSSSTHLTPAEAGRLLGKSTVRVRDMIRFGELTQELVGGRWLIPVEDISRTLNPSSEPRDYEQRVAPKEQRSEPYNKRHQGKLSERKSPSLQQSISKVLPTKKTGDLAAEIERLDRRMKQIDGEIRDMRSGFMSDEKRERIKQLTMEKRKCGKNLQELQRELSRRERRQQPRF